MPLTILKIPITRFIPFLIQSVILILLISMLAQSEPESHGQSPVDPPYDSLCLVGVGKGVDADTNFMDSCWKTASQPKEMDSSVSDTLSQSPQVAAKPASEALRSEYYVVHEPVRRYIEEESFMGSLVGSFLGCIFEGIIEGIFSSIFNHGDQHEGNHVSSTDDSKSKDLFDAHTDRPSRERGVQKK